MSKNTGSTAVAEVAAVSKFTAIADDTAAAVKAFRSNVASHDRMVVAVAPIVFLAYSTGYVRPGLTGDAAKEHKAGGGITQSDYAKMWQTIDKETGKPDSSRSVSVTTLKRWRRLGAALASGIDAKDAAYKYLTVGDRASHEVLQAVLDADKPDEGKIRKAIERHRKAAAKPKSSTTTADDKSGDDSENGSQRVPQLPTGEQTQTELIGVLVAIVGGLDVEKFTPDEYAMAHAAYESLGSKFAAYDKSSAVAS